MRKRWIDLADHADDFAWAEKLALSAFDELSATAEIERDLEVNTVGKTHCISLLIYYKPFHRYAFCYVPVTQGICGMM